MPKGSWVRKQNCLQGNGGLQCQALGHPVSSKGAQSAPYVGGLAAASLFHVPLLQEVPLLTNQSDCFAFQKTCSSLLVIVKIQRPCSSFPGYFIETRGTFSCGLNFQPLQKWQVLERGFESISLCSAWANEQGCFSWLGGLTAPFPRRSSGQPGHGEPQRGPSARCHKRDVCRP